MATEHGRPVILTDAVVQRNSWARSLAARPGVDVVSGVGEIGPIAERIRSQPERIEAALRALIGP